MTSPSRIAVLASGRGSNLQAIVDAIAAGTLDAEVVAVLSDKPDASALQKVAPGQRWARSPKAPKSTRNTIRKARRPLQRPRRPRANPWVQKKWLPWTSA